MSHPTAVALAEIERELARTPRARRVDFILAKLADVREARAAGAVVEWARYPLTAACYTEVFRVCRYCGDPRPDGYGVTCGASDCQEAAYRDAPRPRRRRGGAR